MEPPARSSLDQATSRSTVLLDEVERTLRDWLEPVLGEPVGPQGPGRPPTVPASVLWAGLLVCVLRGFNAQRNLWQLICLHGFWRIPRVEISCQGICQRIAKSPVTALQKLFEEVTSLALVRFEQVCDVPYARFAKEIFALDHSDLDAVSRKTKILRGLKRGERALLPGQLATLFDVRRQMFRRVEFWNDVNRDEKSEVAHWLPHFPPDCLVLFDLGFFSFRWFDQLTDHGSWFISRLRAKTSIQEIRTLFDGPAGPVHLRDRLVYLGAYRADRARHPVRLIEIMARVGVIRYITNVLDPKLLPAAHVVQLYRRRWDIEASFNLLKTHLKLFLVWSGHQTVVIHQVFATLIIAQVVLALRTEVALRARAELREVSLPLLIRWLPHLVAGGEDPIQILADRGRLAGIIRPFRGREYDLPPATLEGYAEVKERPPPRSARYADKQNRGDTRVPDTHSNWTKLKATCKSRSRRRRLS